MTRLYASPTIQVRDRARHLQDAVMGPRGKPQPRNGVFQQLFPISRNGAMLANHLRHHLRVRVSLFLAVKPFQLPVSCLDHPLPHASGILRRRRRPQFLVFHRRNLDVNVTETAAREMVTAPSSSGCRITSSTFRWNSGSSSKKSTPLCPSETSPGRGGPMNKMLCPPAQATSSARFAACCP